MVSFAVRPPEINSAGLWFGPGSATFDAAAATLAQLSAQIAAIRAEAGVTTAAQGVAWRGPTGELAAASQAPHMAWLDAAGPQIAESGLRIAAAGKAFDMARLATPTPVEVAINQMQHMILVATNFLGQNTPAIIANRIQYFGDYWIRSATNMYAYQAESEATVGALRPLPPPPQVTNASQTPAADQAGEQALSGAGAATTLGQPFGAFGPQLMGPALAQMFSGQGMSGLTALPQAASSVAPLASQFANAGNAGAGQDWAAHEKTDEDRWISATPAAGGPVAATLSGGGGGGGIGGTAAATAALRGPVSWASYANAAAPTASTESAQAMSRIAEARAASTTPATSAGMGMPGTMMAPLAAQHGHRDGESDAQPQQRDDTLAAVLYRPPTAMPVITGADGAQFGAGEEER